MGSTLFLRSSLAFFLAASILSCACGPDLVVGPTQVYFIGDVKPWPDFVDGLTRMQEVTKDVAPSDMESDKVFDVVLILYPAKSNYKSGDIVCQYLPGRKTVMADVTGDTVENSCLPHEFWQHSLPYVIMEDANGNHHPLWIEIDKGLRLLAWPAN